MARESESDRLLRESYAALSNAPAAPSHELTASPSEDAPPASQNYEPELSKAQAARIATGVRAELQHRANEQAKFSQSAADVTRWLTAQGVPDDQALEIGVQAWRMTRPAPPARVERPRVRPLQLPASEPVRPSPLPSASAEKKKSANPWALVQIFGGIALLVAGAASGRFIWISIILIIAGMRNLNR